MSGIIVSLVICFVILLNCMVYHSSFFSRKLRSWIDKENAKFVEERKVAKGKVLAAKRKVPTSC